MNQPITTGIVVPVAMLAIAVVCKLLIRRGEISRSDFALGIDATIAAVTSGLIHFCDLYFAYKRAGEITDPSFRGEKRDLIVEAVATASLYFALVVGALLLVMLIQQSWQAPKNKRPKPADTAAFRRGHFWMVLIVGNLLGFGSLVAILLVLRSCTCLEG